ncbi:TPA: hypothetical protein ACOTG0_002121 [Clostridium perfringens]|nr:hypothetical protein phiCPD_00034 [Clostridium phage phiCp-D]
MSNVIKALKNTLNDINSIKEFVETDLKEVYLDAIFWPTKPGYRNIVTVDINGKLYVYDNSENSYVPYLVRTGKEFIVATINSAIGVKKFKVGTEIKIEEMDSNIQSALRSEIELFLDEGKIRLNDSNEAALNFYKRNYPDYYYKYYSYNNTIMRKVNDLIYKNIDKDWCDFTKEKFVFSIEKSLIRLVLNLEQQVAIN